MDAVSISRSVSAHQIQAKTTTRSRFGNFSTGGNASLPTNGLLIGSRERFLTRTLAAIAGQRWHFLAMAQGSRWTAFRSLLVFSAASPTGHLQEPAEIRLLGASTFCRSWMRFQVFGSILRGAQVPLTKLTNPPWYEIVPYRNNRANKARHAQ